MGGGDSARRARRTKGGKRPAIAGAAQPLGPPGSLPPADAVPTSPPVRSTPRRRSPMLASPPARLTAQTSRVAEPSAYSADELRSLRESLGASQSVFAGLVGVSKSLVEHWEGGIRVPSAMARRLLDAIAADPRRFLRELTRPAPPIRRGGPA